MQQNEKYRQTLIGQFFCSNRSKIRVRRPARSMRVIEMDRSVMSLLAAAREELAAGLGKLKLGPGEQCLYRPW